MGVIETLIFTTALAGVGGPGLGGLIGALLQKDSILFRRVRRVPLPTFRRGRAYIRREGRF